MPSIKFLHTADLHLDTPFKGLSNINRELAGRLKNATFSSFQRIIDICIEEQVDFLLVGGDIFDSEAKSLAAQLRFTEELKRLNMAGIPAYIITGNHDPLVSWMEELEMSEMVYRFASTQVDVVTFYKESKALADIYGASFEEKSVDWNLAQSFELKKEPAPFSIALMHGTISSVSSHHPYAPFSLEDIKGKGFDYWALGHVHKRLLVHPSHPAVVYPGNPQGRDFGETGQRGCYIVELDDKLPPTLRFIPTQQIRFEELEVDVSKADKIHLLGESIAEAIKGIDDGVHKTSHILRIRLLGRAALHHHLSQAAEVEALMHMLNEGQLQQDCFQWIDKISVHTMPDIDLENLAKANDFTAEVLRTFHEIAANTSMLDEILQGLETEFSSQASKRELKDLSEEDKQEILMKAKWMLIDQLLS